MRTIGLAFILGAAITVSATPSAAQSSLLERLSTQDVVTAFESLNATMQQAQNDTADVTFPQSSRGGPHKTNIKLLRCSADQTCARLSMISRIALPSLTDGKRQSWVTHFNREHGDGRAYARGDNIYIRRTIDVTGGVSQRWFRRQIDQFDRQVRYLRSEAD